MLAYPTPEAWQTWRRQHETGFAAQLRQRSPGKHLVLLGTSAPESFVRPSTLFAVDDLSPSEVASVVRPAQELARRTSVALVAPITLVRQLREYGFSPGGGSGSVGLSRSTHRPAAVDLDLIDASAVVVTRYETPAARALRIYSRQRSIPCAYIQHGVVTPFAPPLPAEALLFSWSQSDADFWCDGRADVSIHVVGSQMLWEAGSTRRNAHEEQPGQDDQTLCFLGQLHGTELARRVTIATVQELRGRGPLTYRPHPAERDIRSRCRHMSWRCQGVRVLSQALPLTEQAGPVVGIFSTGILQAAAAGRSSYAFCLRPPSWIKELWSRYGMEQLGGTRSTSVSSPSQHPARAIADVLESLV